jgi:hydrogenase nickel incorporation protein HypA/HybF
MHEMSLATDVLDTVVEIARRSDARRVRSVYMTVGKGRDVVEDLFSGLFGYLARGTVADGAEMVFRTTPLTARCRDCGKVYPLNVFDEKTWPCPECGARNYELHSGMEFSIDSVVVE